MGPAEGRASGRGVGLLLVAIAAAGMPLALPRAPLTTLAWCGVSPLLFVLSHHSRLRAPLHAGLFATGIALLASSWLPRLLYHSLGATAAGALGVWLLLGALAFPLAALFGAAVGRPGGRSWLYAPGVAVGWTLVELGYARVFPGLSWLTIAAPAIDSVVAPVASVLGVHSVSGLILGVNAVLAQALFLGSWSRALRGAAVLLGVTGVGLWAAPDAPGPLARSSLRIAFVQPGLPMSARTHPTFASRNLTALIDQSRTVESADLILWPESAFVSTVDARPLLRDRVMRFVGEAGVPVLAGAYRRTEGGLRTSAVLFEPDALPRPVWDKQRLVPLAESVPNWVSPAMRRALGRLVPSMPLEPGTHDPASAERPFGLAVLLCDEASYSGAPASPRAPLLANLVNDGWYDRTAGAEQQLQLARWRAVESGAPLVRVAATGVSALIDPAGTITHRIEVGEAGVRIVDLPLTAVITPFERLGYGPVVAAALLLFLLAARGHLSSTSPQETP